MLETMVFSLVVHDNSVVFAAWHVNTVSYCRGITTNVIGLLLMLQGYEKCYAAAVVRDGIAAGYLNLGVRQRLFYVRIPKAEPHIAIDVRVTADA